MTNRELIARLSQEDPDAEVMLTVDIQGELELRPVGGVRPANLWLENDIYLLVTGALGFKGVILDPDHTVDENLTRTRELARLSHIQEKRDALPPVDPMITELCMDWEFGLGPFATHSCLEPKGHAGEHTNGTESWK